MTEKKIRYEKPVLTDLTGPEAREAQGMVQATCRLGNEATSVCTIGAGATGTGCANGTSAHGTGGCAAGNTASTS
jgi:hypothetical protein